MLLKYIPVNFFSAGMCITKDVYDKKHQDFADKLQLLNIELEEHTNADYE